MTDTAKLSEQVARGQDAKSAQQALDEAFTALEKQCFDTFRRSDIHDDAGRKTCRLYLRVLEDVKQRFTTAIVTGDAASKALLKLKDESKLKKVFKRV